jgi:hypothetical protein
LNMYCRGLHDRLPTFCDRLQQDPSLLSRSSATTSRPPNCNVLRPSPAARFLSPVVRPSRSQRSPTLCWFPVAFLSVLCARLQCPAMSLQYCPYRFPAVSPFLLRRPSVLSNPQGVSICLVDCCRAVLCLSSSTAAALSFALPLSAARCPYHQSLRRSRVQRLPPLLSPLRFLCTSRAHLRLVHPFFSCSPLPSCFGRTRSSLGEQVPLLR